MESIGVSEFRANVSSVLLRVKNGEIISVMQRGNEIARLVPPDFARLAAQRELERLRQTAVVTDVITPLDVDWEMTT